MNHSLAGSRTKRSTSPRPRSPRKSVPKEKKIQTSSNFIQSNPKKRQILNNVLDSYHLIINTSGSFRCLEHASVLSLYCQTDQKLLCANCIYGTTDRHRHHKIFPLQKCYTNISRDIEQISRHCERQIQNIYKYEEQLKEYFNQEEKEANLLLLELSKKYCQIKTKLDENFEHAKRKVVQKLDNLGISQTKMLLELGRTKNVYQSNSLQGKSKVEREELLVYYHLIGGALLKNGEVEFKNTIKAEDSIKNLRQQELKRAQDILLKLAISKPLSQSQVRKYHT